MINVSFATMSYKFTFVSYLSFSFPPIFRLIYHRRRKGENIGNIPPEIGITVGEFRKLYF